MNIFILDLDPLVCSRLHCNKHVVKQILESAQLLSTAHRVLNGISYVDSSKSRRSIRYRLDDERESLYSASHVNHPCNRWARTSSSNYYWLFSLFKGLLEEYTFRYGKIHSSSRLIPLLSNHPLGLEDTGLTTFSICMPDYCKINSDPVESYRNYYIKEKLHFAKYTKRDTPEWISNPYLYKV